MRASITALALLALVPRASAQGVGPQACGQSTSSAAYGEVTVGSIVVPQRHRYVGGDPNWDARMARFLGRVAHVTRASGVDAQGCPGVRLDVDGGEFFWRVRDVNLGAEQPREPAQLSARIPEACGSPLDYGPVRVGARVVIGRHRVVEGDDNWMAGMRAYVGRTARIVTLAGGDDQGCPGVHVDVDHGEWFWRIRDMHMAEEGETDAVAVAGGIAAEHGRASRANDARADERLPQACGMTDETADYGPVRVGTEVVLGHHRDVQGESNWVEGMDRYVDRRARVTQLVGVDDQGCPLIAVDIDQGDWYWRLRDVRLP